MHERPMLEHLRACPWRYDHSLFKAWVQGATGVPIVDAAMQELWSTGWMHNRLRVVASSFLVKNLLLPWQWGLKHFWDALLDADLECAGLAVRLGLPRLQHPPAPSAACFSVLDHDISPL